MFAKIEIKAELELVTGLHIGGSDAFSAIGSVDSPIVKDILTDMPMIPGSSLKGKMRALLAKQYNDTIKGSPNDDADCLTDIFGKSGDKHKNSKVIFSDMLMKNWDELKNNYGLTSKTEVKFENTINRLTSEANPRQIERAVRGSKFDVSIVYEVLCKDGDTALTYEKTKEEFKILSNGFKLLEYDYLGGNGTRGYGKVKFSDFDLNVVIGVIDETVLEECRDILNNRN